MQSVVMCVPVLPQKGFRVFGLGIMDFVSFYGFSLFSVGLYGFLLFLVEFSWLWLAFIVFSLVCGLFFMVFHDVSWFF